MQQDLENTTSENTVSVTESDTKKLLGEIQVAFDKLFHLINSPADVALNLIRRALSTPEGEAYIAQALANNLEFRHRMNQEPERPAPDFSQVEIKVAAERGEGPYWTMVRYFDQNDVVYPDTIFLYQQNEHGLNQTQFVPAIDAKIREAIDATGFQIESGKVFYVEIKVPKSNAPTEVPASESSETIVEDQSLSTDDTAGVSDPA